MEVKKMFGKVDNHGYIHIDINLPTNLPPGDTELLLVLNALINKPAETVYDFTDLCGKLNWSGDAVAEQRKIRDEW